jgi:putative phosphoribosyl transferase
MGPWENEMFRDRADAGRCLAKRLGKYQGSPDTLVLALPRGGVPVGFEVARALHLPLDVFVVRKLGVPGHEELAMGALAPGGVQFLNEPLIRELHIGTREIAQVTAQEAGELERRERVYRNGRPAPGICGRTVILVDDGLATGATMRAAVQALRRLQAARIVVAVPVGSPEACEELRGEADQVVCGITPDPFLAVGVWFQDFSATTDQAVRELLAQASGNPAGVPL